MGENTREKNCKLKSRSVQNLLHLQQVHRNCVYTVNLSFYNAITWLQRNVLLFSSVVYTIAFSSSLSMRNCSNIIVYNDRTNSSKPKTVYDEMRKITFSQKYLMKYILTTKTNFLIQKHIWYNQEIAYCYRLNV